jgi:hypothetical protein
MRHIAIAAAAAAGLAGCATTGSAPDQATPPDPLAAMTCKAEPAQAYLGQQATQPNGTAILANSGARTLRWGPPNSAWTMDYREDRVNVRYDETMTITDITCG